MILLDIIHPASVWIQIAIGASVVTLGGVSLSIVKRFIKRWDDSNTVREKHNEKVDRNLMLLNIKSDCTISGLKQMNGQTSKNFSDVYDKQFDARTKDIDWINNKQ